MKAAKTPAIVGVIVTLTSLALVIGMVRSRHAAQASLAEWERREAAVRNAADQSAAALAEASHHLGALRQSLAALKASTATPPSARRRLDYSAYFAKHPETQRAFEQAYGALRGQAYGPLYRRLGLSPEQIGHLNELMTKDTENMMDLYSVAQAKNLPLTDPAIVQMRTAQQADLAAQEQATLGAEGFAQLQQFNAGNVVRSVVGVATSTAVASEAGMTAEQEEQVTQLLLQTSSARQSNPAQPIDPSTVDWNVVATQGQNFLNPDQIAAIQAQAAEIKFIALKSQYFQKQSAGPK